MPEPTALDPLEFYRGWTTLGQPTRLFLAGGPGVPDIGQAPAAAAPSPGTPSPGTPAGPLATAMGGEAKPQGGTRAVGGPSGTDLALRIARQGLRFLESMGATPSHARPEEIEQAWQQYRAGERDPFALGIGTTAALPPGLTPADVEGVKASMALMQQPGFDPSKFSLEELLADQTLLGAAVGPGPLEEAAALGETALREGLAPGGLAPSLSAAPAAAGAAEGAAAAGPALTGAAASATQLGAGLLGPILQLAGVDAQTASQIGAAASMAASLAAGNPIGLFAAPLALGLAETFSRPGPYVRHRQEAAQFIPHAVPYVFGRVLMAQTPEELQAALRPFDQHHVRLEVGPEGPRFAGGYEIGERLWSQANPRLAELVQTQRELIDRASRGDEQARAMLAERARQVEQQFLLGGEMLGGVRTDPNLSRLSLADQWAAAVFGPEWLGWRLVPGGEGPVWVPPEAAHYYYDAYGSLQGTPEAQALFGQWHVVPPPPEPYYPPTP